MHETATPPTAATDATGATDATPLQGVRVQSIDLLRGLDVLLMLLVNDLAGVPGTPAFLKHVPASVDGMTITDAVFPAFLFITGMSIPLALDGRLRRGGTRAAAWRHVLARALSLIVIGVFMVNGEYATDGGPLSPALWTVLMTIAVVLVWRVPNQTRSNGDVRARAADAGAEAAAGATADAAISEDVSARTPAAGAARAARTATARHVSLERIIGVLALIVLALVYHSGDVPSLGDFRTHWWGILGLIGWAYLPAAALYLLATPSPASARAPASASASTAVLAGEEREPRKSWRTLAILGGMAALCYALSIFGRLGLLTWLGPARSYVSVALGTQTAVALCGVILTVLLQRHTNRRASGERQEIAARRAFVPIALGYAAALGGASLLLHALSDHPAFWFSKLQGSAPWGLASAALTATAWTALFILVDIRGWRRWPSLVPTAGELALLIYLGAPFVLSLFAIGAALTGLDFYSALARPTPLGFARAIGFTWGLVSLCGWLRARGLRVRL